MEPRHPEPQDGIYCDECRCSGWIAVTEENGATAMAHCPKCWERRQVVRRLKQSGVSPKDYENTHWSPSTGPGLKWRAR